MILSEKQRVFALHVGKLLIEARLRGYAFAIAAAYRDPAWGVGHPRSLHGSKLAIDLDLFKWDADTGWEYCKDTEDHAELGAWWKAQHPDFRWGGDFGDGNHYSMTHGGMR